MKYENISTLIKAIAGEYIGPSNSNISIGTAAPNEQKNAIKNQLKEDTIKYLI